MKKILLIVTLLTILIACQTDGSDDNSGTGVTGGSAWNGTTMTEPTIVNNYYLISEPAHLAWLAGKDDTLRSEQQPIDINIRFTADIDMGNKPFKGIKKFQGIVDGDNKSIKNLVIEDPLEKFSNIALIREVTGNTTIKYLTLANGTSIGTDSAAGFVADFTTVSGNDFSLIIDNSTNNLKVSSSISASIGGFIGKALNVKIIITNSKNIADIIITNSDRFPYIGGFIGEGSNSDITITDSFNTGNLTSGPDGSIAIGGIIGDGQATITNTHNTGDITGSSKDGNADAGGIIGSGSGIITNVYNTGTIKSSDVTGGIIGDGYGTIKNSYNKGDLSSYNAGGIIGNSGSGGAVNITDSYNEGNISNTIIGIEITLGGIIGRNINQNVIIDNSYNSGDITNTNELSDKYLTIFIGGIIGRSFGGLNITTDISYSHNTGNINNRSHGNNNIAGILGDNHGGNMSVTVKKSYNTGIITNNSSSKYNNVAGIYGTNNSKMATITDTYNTGNITSNATSDISSNYVGGIASKHTTIEKSFSYGNIKTAGNVDEFKVIAGAIVGELIKTVHPTINGTTTYTNNFWYAPTTPTASTIQTGGAYLTAIEFKEVSKFTGWDIDKTGSAWEMLPSAKYPTLKAKVK